MFLVNLITLLPFQVLLDGIFRRIVYLIKIIRFLNGFAVFDVDVVYRNIKQYVHNNLLKKIEDDPSIGDDKDEDHNGIIKLL